MRIPSGVTDQFIYFVALDANDLTTRETGLSSFTVYRSRNGAAAAAMTTPTINEVDSTNMPGLYELLLDEDMDIASGNLSEEMAFHITHSGMAPVTRSIELYRHPMEGVIYGSVDDATPLTTDFTAASGLSASDDFYNGVVLQFTSGTLNGLARRVEDYTGSTRSFSFANNPWPAAPADADTFRLIGLIET